MFETLTIKTVNVNLSQPLDLIKEVQTDVTVNDDQVENQICDQFTYYEK